MIKIKQFLANDRVFYSLLLTLIAVTAFGLGRLSVLETTSSPQPSSSGVPAVQLLQSAVVTTAETAASTSRSVVASKQGTRYYYEHCAGVDRIKEANKVFFGSAEAAQAAGYTLAQRCAE